MPTLVSIAVILATVFGTEWLVDGWLGQDRRHWVALTAIPLMLLSGALIQASGIHEVTRVLRNAVIGAGIGAVLRRTGLRLPLLRGGLRLLDVETEAEVRPVARLRWSGLGEWLLRLGSICGLVALGMIWTGVFAD